ncbi:hypothetical protein Zm00014a_013419 [Zea mays]|uniref:Uncharacterized protein n=1 Tax=Zea mays TaxID=4577 RepID=A0A3L6G4R4_MAIZE|nr:hypothetical protein Zm00014a_013419 [Zea mays]
MSVSTFYCFNNLSLVYTIKPIQISINRSAISLQNHGSTVIGQAI